MQSFKALSLASLFIVGSAASLQANPVVALPQNAKPLDSEETRNIYKDKTMDFYIAKYYFNSDNKVVGYSQNPSSYATGSWSVSDNEFCMSVVWRGLLQANAVNFNSCSRWFFDGAAYWIKIVKSSSPELIGKVYKRDESIVSPGDTVTESVSRIKQQIGH
jgi:hypothetical protein